MLHSVLLFAAILAVAILLVRRSVSLPQHIDLASVDEPALTAAERRSLDELRRQLEPLGFSHALSYRGTNIPAANLTIAFLSSDRLTCAIALHSTLAGSANSIHLSTRYADGTEVLTSSSVQASRTFVPLPGWRTTRLPGASLAALQKAHEAEQQKSMHTPIPWDPETLLVDRGAHEDASLRHQAAQGLLRLEGGRYRATTRFAVRGVLLGYNPLDGFTFARLWKGLVLSTTPSTLVAWKWSTLLPLVAGRLGWTVLAPTLLGVGTFGWSAAAAGALFSMRPRIWAFLLVAPALWLLPEPAMQGVAIAATWMASSTAAALKNRREQVVKAKRSQLLNRLALAALGIGIGIGVHWVESMLPGRTERPRSTRYLSVTAQVPPADAAVDALNAALERQTPPGERSPEFMLAGDHVTLPLAGAPPELARQIRILQATSRADPSLRFSARAGSDVRPALLSAGIFSGPSVERLQDLLALPATPPPGAGAAEEKARTISAHPELARVLDGEELTWLSGRDRLVLDARGTLRTEPVAAEAAQPTMDGRPVVREERGQIRRRVRYVVGGRQGPWVVNPRVEERTRDRVAFVGEVDGKPKAMILDLRTLQLEERPLARHVSSVIGDGGTRLFAVAPWAGSSPVDEDDDDEEPAPAGEPARPPAALLELTAGAPRAVVDLDATRFGPRPRLCAFLDNALWVQGVADLFRVDPRTGAVENVTAPLSSPSPRELLRAERVRDAWLVSFANGSIHVLRGADRWDVPSQARFFQAALSPRGTLAVLAVDAGAHSRLRVLRRGSEPAEVPAAGFGRALHWRFRQR